MRPEQIVEAVLFSSDAPLRGDEIARADEELDEDRVEEAIRSLRAHYLETDRAFDVVEVAGGYQILTRPEYASYLDRFDTVPRSPRLSGPALETLAIIAYRQPIGRLEIEYIRGVGSTAVIRTLQDRGLVDVVGRAEGIGRPLLYGTTSRFLEHFGFRSIDDLPRPEELPVVLRDPESPILPDADEEQDETEESHSPEDVDGAAGDEAGRPDPTTEEDEADESSREASDHAAVEVAPEGASEAEVPEGR